MQVIMFLILLAGSAFMHRSLSNEPPRRGTAQSSGTSSPVAARFALPRTPTYCKATLSGARSSHLWHSLS